MPAAAPAVDDALRACPQCHAHMAQVRLHSHTGGRVLVDHCAACRVVWFDTLESVQLSGLGWVELLREFARDEGQPPVASRPPTLACPLCTRPLKAVHNRTRWGRFPAQECPIGHGHLHSDAGVLAERGLVRPLLPPERGAIAAQRRVLHCLSCGAAAEGDGETCHFCASPLLVVDLPRLAHALRQRGAAGEALPPADGVPLRWPCHGCGHTLDPTRSAACPQCGAGVVAPSLDDLKPLLDTAEHELRAAANHPPKAKRRAQLPPRTWRDTQLARLWRLFRPD
ncbi:MAG: zf-TFIIB domain-containing protein [Rubrivivax sp.]|nr:zf-TFIIB domain-containing protein [Rubrivivax sp.]